MKKFTFTLSILMLISIFSYAQNVENLNKVKKHVYFQEKIQAMRSAQTPIRSITEHSRVCESLPFFVDFENETEVNKWTIHDLNSDGSTWGIGTDIVRSGTHSLTYMFADAAANDWAVTPCFDLAAGKYTFSLYYAVSPMAGMMETVESFAIGYGTTTNPASWTNIIYSNNNVVNAEWLKVLCDVEITTAGTYYFGIKATSIADQLLLAIDDVSLDVSKGDLSIANVILPFPSCAIGTTEQVSAVIENTESLPATLTKMAYEKSGVITIETLTTPVTINSGENYTYTFTKTADFTTKDSVKVWLISSDDTNPSNDVSAWYSTFRLTPLTNANLPFTMGFEDNEDLDRVSIWNMNNDGETWNFLTTEGGAYPDQGYNSANCMAAASLVSDADDWMVLSCFELNAGDYNISLMLKTFGVLEHFAIGYGTMQDPSTWNIIYEGQSDVTEWEQIIANLINIQAGTYYIGIKDQTLTTSTSGFFLYIDNFSIASGAVLLPDIALELVDAPVSGCDVTNAETLTVHYRNAGNTIITSITANYKLSNQAVVTETISGLSLAPGKTGNYTFNATIDMTFLGILPLNTWLNIPNDVDASNDAILKKVSHVEPLNTEYYASSFEDDFELEGWQIPNGWQIIEGNAQEGSYYLYSNVVNDAGLYTRCFDLYSGKYEISFYVRAGFSMMGETWRENFSIGYGTEQNIDAMTMFIEQKDIYYPNWTKVSGTFELDKHQVIYIGVFCDVNIVFDVDNFVFRDVTSESIHSVEKESFTIYPNPTSNQVTLKNDIQKMNHIRVFDITGKLLMEHNNVNDIQTTIDLSGFAQGIYFLNVDGEVLKVVKQ